MAWHFHNTAATLPTPPGNGASAGDVPGWAANLVQWIVNVLVLGTALLLLAAAASSIATAQTLRQAHHRTTPLRCPAGHGRHNQHRVTGSPAHHAAGLPGAGCIRLGGANAPLPASNPHLRHNVYAIAVPGQRLHNQLLDYPVPRSAPPPGIVITPPTHPPQRLAA